MTSLYSAAYPRWNSGIEPAPGELRIIQAFVNTLDIEKGEDDIETTQDLSGWLVEWGLTKRGVPLAEGERRQAKRFREGLRELLLSNNGDEGDRSRRPALERVLENLPLRCSLDASPNFELVAVSTGWPQAAARLLTVVARTMGEGTWIRLKACARDDCQWAFYDFSKNRSGKWCAMEGCGNLMKARAYRRRLRSGAEDR